MAAYEKHVLVGNVGGDVTMRYTTEGIAVASFSLAVNNPFKKDDPPVWYKVSAWRALAETVNAHVTRGMPVLVEGDRLELDEWTAQDGEKRTTLALTAQRVVFLGRRDDAQPEADSDPF